MPDHQLAAQLAAARADFRACVRLEDIGEFVAWLRLPPMARDGKVAVRPSVERHCTVSVS